MVGVRKGIGCSQLLVSSGILFHNSLQFFSKSVILSILLFKKSVGKVILKLAKN